VIAAVRDKLAKLSPAHLIFPIIENESQEHWEIPDHKVKVNSCYYQVQEDGIF
jgi:hypothetical protein